MAWGCVIWGASPQWLNLPIPSRLTCYGSCPRPKKRAFSLMVPILENIILPPPPKILDWLQTLLVPSFLSLSMIVLALSHTHACTLHPLSLVPPQLHTCIHPAPFPWPLCNHKHSRSSFNSFPTITNMHTHISSLLSQPSWPHTAPFTRTSLSTPTFLTWDSLHSPLNDLHILSCNNNYLDCYC